MKTLSKLEKNKSFWSILTISLLFFLLRLPSVIEPYWYGDEGIYQVIGHALNQGRLLYVDIWDNKPPFLYVIHAIFNGNQESIRMASLLVGIVTTISFFALSQKLFRKLSTSIIATTFFAVLFATPFLEGNIANAENFMLLPIIAAGLLIYQIKPQPPTANRQPLFIAGLLLGISFMFKIVAIFDLAAFILFLILSSLRGEKNERRSNPVLNSYKPTGLPRSFFARNDIVPVILGFVAPLFIATIFFLSQGAVKEFFQATFSGNISYVGLENTFFNIPQGLLILKLLLLLLAVTLIFFKRHVFSKPTLFILLWLTFSLFNAFFSQRPYTHYLLVLLPSICLFIGLLFDIRNKKMKFLIVALLIGIGFLIKENFWISTLHQTARYYQNVTLFITGHKDVKSYRSFFDPRTPRDYELAALIAKNTTTTDDVFIWGDSAQVYSLAHKLPINKYTVAYHIKQTDKRMHDTQIALTLKKPKYIIVLSETSAIPFSVPFYSVRQVLTGATIYERNF